MVEANTSIAYREGGMTLEKKVDNFSGPNSNTIQPLRIGMITILKTNNYGAELQSFALCHKLQKIGFDAQIIDFLFYKNRQFKQTKKARSFVDIGLKRKFKEWLNPILNNIRTFPYIKAKVKRDILFKKFHEQHTTFSPKTFHSVDELYHSDLSYDIFIVGSDQVWNPYSNINLEPYFLTFAPESKKKISYASSFGVSEVPSSARPKYKECLNNLNYIGVREEKGADLVKELTGRQASHVLDPTLLLGFDDWKEVASFPKEKQEYLLIYILTSSKYATKLAASVAKELGLKIIRICKNAVREDSDKSICNIIDAGPSEYVGLFMNASFVITNSFHGTAFSVNFKKSFYTILPMHKENNSRQESLLAKVALSNRLIKEGTPLSDIKDHIVDFSESTEKLEQERQYSLDYLVNAING